MAKPESEMEALNYIEGTIEELTSKLQRDKRMSEVAIINKRIDGMEARYPRSAAV